MLKIVDMIEVVDFVAEVGSVLGAEVVSEQIAEKVEVESGSEPEALIELFREEPFVSPVCVVYPSLVIA